MYAVESDQTKRLLLISGVGRFTAVEVAGAAARVRELVADFEPGFQALTDFRFLESMEAAAAPHVGQIMDALAAKQVACVVRVMPDPKKDIGLNILSPFHYGPEIRIVTVENLTDGLTALVETIRNNAESSPAR